MGIKGFYPDNNAALNSKALQTALDKGGCIYIDDPGVYEISETILIGDNTVLEFAEGVRLKRTASEGETGVCIGNKGMFTGETNYNITLIGLNLITNGIDSTPFSGTTERAIPGVRGHVFFMYVSNLVIRDFTILDVNKKDYALQITDFSNVLVENVRIEGMKDGIHFGPGNGFILRHAYFCTYDDPVALNASDYSVSNPHLGWIENGLIEDCYDLDAPSTCGYFARLLTGAWTDWYKGMEIQQSDAVVYNGKVYRAVMSPDGSKYISLTPPTHTSGYEILDGIRWVKMQDEAVYNAGVRNIAFRDIYLKKRRDVAIAITYDKSDYLRSYYPGSPESVNENISMKNINVLNRIDTVLSVTVNTDRISISDSDLADSVIKYSADLADGYSYKQTELRMSNVHSADPEAVIVNNGMDLILKY